MYGDNDYDIDILTELIYRLETKDEIQRQSSICNVYHSQINIKQAFQSLNISQYFVNKAIKQFQKQYKSRPYHFDIIAKHALKLRSRHTFRLNHTFRLKRPKKYKKINTNILKDIDKKQEEEHKENIIFIHSSLDTFNDDKNTENQCDDNKISIDEAIFKNTSNEMLIGLGECNKNEDNVAECDSFKRLNHILCCYQQWINNDKHNHGFYDIVNNENIGYSNAALLDDYHHLMVCHQNKFEQIYESLECKCNDHSSLIECQILKRMSENTYDLNENKKDDQETNIQQIMDIIHIFFLHSFDLKLKFTKLEIDEIDQYESDILQQDKMKGDTAKIRKMNEIISRKKSKNGIERHHQKYITNVNKYNNENICDFGVAYEYFNKFDEYFIIPKYKSFKDEMLKMINMNEWNILNIRSLNFQQKQYSRLLRASYDNDLDEETHKIAKGTIIAISHLIAIQIYCNYKDVQTKFVQSCLTPNNDSFIIDRQRLVKIHSKYGHLGLLLYQTVHVFGDCVFNEKFYHCLNRETYFSSSVISISCPISVTKNMNTMLTAIQEYNDYNNNNNHNNMNNDDYGHPMIIRLNDNNDTMKSFSCNFLSFWGAENELFMIGNEPFLQQQFVINGIIGMSDNEYIIYDYTQWLMSWNIIDLFIKGWHFDITNIDKYESINNVENIFIQISNMIKLSGSRNHDNIININYNNNTNIIPRYFALLFYKYAMKINQIEIDWFYLNQYYQFLVPFLCFQGYDFISLNILLSLFVNCSKISINGGINRNLKFSLKLIENVYEFLFKNWKQTQLKEINIWNMNTNHVSLRMICVSNREKFKKIHWNIYTEMQNDFETLIFIKSKYKC